MSRVYNLKRMVYPIYSVCTLRRYEWNLFSKVGVGYNSRSLPYGLLNHLLIRHILRHKISICHSSFYFIYLLAHLLQWSRLIECINPDPSLCNHIAVEVNCTELHQCDILYSMVYSVINKKRLWCVKCVVKWIKWYLFVKKMRIHLFKLLKNEGTFLFFTLKKLGNKSHGI